MTLTIWHNPRCSKSRDTLAILEAEGVEPEVRLYLKDPPSSEELRDVLAKLDIPASSLVRRAEKLYRELGLPDDADDEILVAAMADNPSLIERPIVINEDRAAIGRPPSAVISIL